jgi:serine O-acetyltransferase
MNLPGNLLIQTDGLDPETVLPLATYVAKQLNSAFPSTRLEDDVKKIYHILPITIQRLKPILRAVCCFRNDVFQYNNSLQYCTFLYLLANVQSKIGADSTLSDRLFCLNKSLNGIDLFYGVEMPELFFVSHGVGSVGNRSPVIGNDAVLYPGAVVTGSTIIGNNSVVSAGTILHNVTIPDNVVAKLESGRIVLRENRQNYVDLYIESNA